MSWNQRWNMAEPDGSVRTPSEINLFSREDVLIERSSNRERENVRVIHRISFRIIVVYFEKSIEVIGMLIDVNDHYGPFVPHTAAQASDGGSHRSQ
jgi:hypothetical protein